MSTHSFLPQGFDPPEVVWQSRYRIRPLRIEDADIDYDCYMSCVEHIRTGGFIQPPDTSYLDWPRTDQTRRWATVLIGHAEYLMAAGSALEYGIFDLSDTQEYGCLYIRPARVDGYAAAVTFWIRDSHCHALDSDLYEFVRRWIDESFPFESEIAYPGRSITWDQWTSLTRAQKHRTSQEPNDAHITHRGEIE